MIGVLVVDDHPVIRSGLRAMLAGYPDLEIVAEASSAEEAIELAATAGPDVVLMDLNLGVGMDGIQATRRIRAGAGTAPQVLVLTNVEREADILAAIGAGATGYLLKDAPPDELASGLRRAAAGEAVLTSSAARALMTRANGPEVRLTVREQQVLELVALGRSNLAVADELVLQSATVKAHLTRIFTKLDVSSRTEAVAVARRRGLIR